MIPVALSAPPKLPQFDVSGTDVSKSTPDLERTGDSLFFMHTETLSNDGGYNDIGHDGFQKSFVLPTMLPQSNENTSDHILPSNGPSWAEDEGLASASMTSSFLGQSTENPGIARSNAVWDTPSTGSTMHPSSSFSSFFD